MSREWREDSAVIGPGGRRLRRLRATAAMRDWVADVVVPKRSLIQPLFVAESASSAGPVGSLPGIARETLDETLRTVERDLELGIRSFLLFGVPAVKDATGEAALDEGGIVPTTLRALSSRFGTDIVLSADLCLCTHLEHGHCGFVTSRGDVRNDASAALLARVGAVYAASGAAVIAPSDMMDGRIGALRRELDGAGFESTSILSYAVKYASNYYGAFREAAGSAPAFGDRRSYQMDFRRTREPLLEVEADVAEGADLVMVKPALAYLDVIAQVRSAVSVPVVAYNVSGEYAAVHALAAAGLADLHALALENLVAMRRAGADSVITYHARALARAGRLDS